jgi:oligosaccharyltransferase complex subunit gamma
MRWLQAFLSFSLLSVGALGAKKSTEERFKEYHTKALSSAPVKLNDASYKELTALPRDYTSVVLLTALDARFGCELCRQFQPEWELLSRSWTKGDKSGGSRVIFSTLDFSDGRETFVSVCLPLGPMLLAASLT